MPWGYSPSQAQYPQAAPPSLPQTPASGPKVTPQAADMSQPRTPVPASDPNSFPAVQDLKAWCVQHALGDTEYEGLSKLGFRVGDGHELAGLEMSVWEWAGVPPFKLARARILSACQSTVSSRSESN